MRASTSTQNNSPASVNRTSVALTLIAIGMLFLLALLRG